MEAPYNLFPVTCSLWKLAPYNLFPITCSLWMFVPYSKL
jgi:hypothetical protein